MSTTDPTNTRGNSPPKNRNNLLYRSRIEICRILQDASLAKSQVCSELNEELFFVSQILSVEADSGGFILAYGEDKASNAEIFKHDAMLMTVIHKGVQLAFKASEPKNTVFEGQSAIRFSLPDMLVEYHRRGHIRYRVASNVSLRFEASQTDGTIFDAKMIDISHDGIGFMSYNPGITLTPGTILKNCRIIIPGGVPVIVDLIVHRSKTVTRNDGTLAVRTAVRFMQTPTEIKSLINVFIKDISIS